MSEKRLFLLDGMALVYRAHFAFLQRPIFNSRGLNTSALFGFTSTLLELRDSQHPTHIAVALDTPAPTARHRVYPEYKAHREEMPEDLAAALPHLRRLIDAFRIRAVSLDGFEADDLMGTLARRAAAAGFVTFLVTSDKDFGQLVDERTFIYKPGYRGDEAQILGVEQILERWGIERVDQVRDILGLAGDSSDNIPGVPKVGPKTAQKLIAQHGTLEALLERAASIPGKLGENLREHAALARLSKQLATIDTSAPVDLPLDALKIAEPDPETLRALCDEFEFTRLGRRILGDAYTPSHAPQVGPAGSPDEQSEIAQPPPHTAQTIAQGELFATPTIRTLHEAPHDYAEITSEQDRRALAHTLLQHNAFCLDVETAADPPRDALDPRRARLLGIAFCHEESRGAFVRLSPDPARARAELDDLRPALVDPRIEKVGHNLKFDLSVLARHGITVEGPLFDTMLAHALVEPEMRHGMDHLAEVYLRYRPQPISELIGDPKNPERSLADVDPRALFEYSVEDADVTWQLRALFDRLLREREQERVFFEVEMPLLPALVAMEDAGVRVDPDVLRDCSRQLDAIIAEQERAIFQMVGREFNLNSPRQLGQVLFEELHLLDAPKRTRKTGQYSTGEEVLATLAPRHEIARRILEYREATKLKGTYVDALPGFLSPVTGRIHASFGQLHTVTGRLQSDTPNLQNIPARSDLGRQIRQAFVPGDPGRVLLSADYSQIELRIIAALSKDHHLLAAFARGEDIHTATAAHLYAVDPAEVTREMRARAKMVNFGIPYGISPFGLANRLGIGRAEAAALIDQYFNRFPGVRTYIEQALADARRHGFARTLLGRRRLLRDINSRNAAARAAAERNAINMPIQGTAADMIKVAMANIHAEFRSRQLGATLILQIHDELLFEVPREEIDAVRPLVDAAMRDAIALDAPIKVEIGVGDNWLEAH